MASLTNGPFNLNDLLTPGMSCQFEYSCSSKGARCHLGTSWRSRDHVEGFLPVPGLARVCGDMAIGSIRKDCLDWVRLLESEDGESGVGTVIFVGNCFLEGGLRRGEPVEEVGDTKLRPGTFLNIACTPVLSLPRFRAI